MAVIAVFSASHCGADEVVARLAERLHYRVATDKDLLAAASAKEGTSADKLERAIRRGPGFFNRLTREKEKSVSALRGAMIGVVEPDNIVYHGFGALLLPRTLTHVLRVCLAAPSEHRLKEAEKKGVARRQAEKEIAEYDLSCAEWTKFLFDAGPWDKSLYDTFLPMQTLSLEEAADKLCDYARRPGLGSTEDARAALEDARLAALVDRELVQQGYDTDVSSRKGEVTIEIRKHTLRMKSLQEKLEAVARGVAGVKSASARPGARYQEPSVYGQMELDVPTKVLLVDDEKEFVHTLSERLQTRRIRPAIAYDGEEALSMVESDQPEVMVLDLKMPGVDGLEVLRRMKQKHPGTEVIILTGHGSDKEERVARELGAFAYLRKPVDIELLTDTMKQAYRKAASSGSAGGSPPEKSP